MNKGNILIGIFITYNESEININDEKIINEEIISSGFTQIENNLYMSDIKTDIDAAFDLIDNLSNISESNKYIRNIHRFQMNGLCNLNKRLKWI